MLLGLLLFNGLSSLVGGLALMTAWIPEQPSWIRDTDFTSNYFPGVILLAVVGGSSLIAAISLMKRSDGWQLASIVAGIIMVTWIVGEIASIRAFHPLQMIYLVTGVLVVALTAGRDRIEQTRPDLSGVTTLDVHSAENEPLAIPPPVRSRDSGTGSMGAARSGLRAAYLLTAVTAAVMATVSAVGVFAADWLYRDNALMTATFRGQDMVTLAVAVPLLLVALVMEMKGSLPGRLLWLGMLFYAMYAYLFYAVAAAFNPLFLLYVATFGLPLYALLFSVPRLDLTRLGASMGGRAARLAALTYTSVVAVGLGLLWVGISLGYLITDKVPQPIVNSGHPTGVVFAIDLVFIVPPMLLAAVWLARRRALGWVLASVISIGGTIYTLTLAVASVEVARQDLGDGAELPIWTGLTVLGVTTVVLLLASTRRSGGHESTDSVPDDQPGGAIEASEPRRGDHSEFGARDNKIDSSVGA